MINRKSSKENHDVVYVDNWKESSLFDYQKNPNELDKISRIHMNLLSLQYAKVGPEWRSGKVGHTSHFHNLHFVVDGSAKIFHGRTTFNLLPGNVYWLPANCPLRYRCDKMYEHYFVVLKWEWMNGMDLFMTNCAPMMLGTWPVSEFKAGWEKAPFPIESLWRLHVFIQKLFADNIKNLEKIFSIQNDLHIRFSKVFEYVDRNISADLDVTQLANLMGLSRDGFYKNFKEAFGIAPRNFLNQRLNRRVLDMVVSTDLRMKEISIRLGFRDEYYFNRFFSKMNAISPLQYRKRFTSFRQE